MTVTYDALSRMVEQTKSGTSTEIVYDALGNKLALMNGTSTLNEAFVPLPAGAAEEKRFAKLGHRDTTETGLDPTAFRMYASAEGRWFSADPVRACPLHPQGFNRYSYAAGDPVNHVDPTGRYIIDPLDPGCFDPGCGCDPFTDFSCDPGFCDPSDPTCGGGLGSRLPGCIVQLGLCISIVNTFVTQQVAKADAELTSCLSGCRHGNPLLFPSCSGECLANFAAEEFAIDSAEQEGFEICAVRFGLCLQGNQ